MRLGVLQIPYANTEDGAEAAVAAAIDALNGCHEACDVILTPEYTNAPAHFNAGCMMPFAAAHTEALLQAARAAACRCHAVVAMNYLCETEPGVFRNTTEILDRSGRSAGRFFKQHLTEAEQEIAGLDSTYTRQFRPPTVVEVDGIRFACVICYDIYFSEYVSQIAHGRPDVILVPSFQRGERKEIIRMQNQYLAFRCNSFVVRASVSMGTRARLGGMSLIAAPDGRILKEWSNRCGLFFCEVGDIKQKYMRGNGFGGKMIAGDRFVEQSRETWAYRPCGSMTVESEACMGYPRICAHRGFNTVAPENSLAAFGAAIALGAPEIELDVRFTRDGIPVVAHDSELQRQAGVPGTVEEKTLAELEQLDFNHGGNRHFAHTKIATLEQVLAQFARHVIINLHLKSGEGEYPRSWMKKILDLLESYDQQEHIYFMGDPDVMRCARECAPSIPRCMGAFPEPWKIVERAIEYECTKVQFFTPYYDQKMIDQAHEAGLCCNLFFCDDAAAVKQHLTSGIDTILTNDYWSIARAAAEWVQEQRKK